MKKKIVLWGTDAQEQRVLIALALQAAENKVDLYTFPESIATEEFVKQMHSEWRDGKEVAFPEGFTHQVRPLAISESLLPDDIKTDRADLISRAQTEWHFVVLSGKLHQAYQTELEDFKEKIGQMTAYDSATWNSLKGFWDKVQKQIRDRNLLREHIEPLREETNGLFDRLKELRASLDAEFEKRSNEAFTSFSSTLEDIENRITNSKKYKAIFNELKSVQSKFKGTKMSKEHRNKLWNRLDAAFKSVKEKQFGKDATNDSPVDRLNRRVQGLTGAMEKMQKSINRDNKDLEYENKRIANSDGQLEAQIRQAKIAMVQERIRSKQEKLEDMKKTMEDLHKRIEKEKVREEKRQEAQKRKEAQKAAKEKIAQEIEHAKENMEAEKDKLSEAASAINENKKEKSDSSNEAVNMANAVMKTLGESIGDVVDTAKAVAEVIGEKLEEQLEEVKETVQEYAAAAKETVEETIEEIQENMQDKEADTSIPTAEIMSDAAAIATAVDAMTDVATEPTTTSEAEGTSDAEEEKAPSDDTEA